ncbi:MAG: TetR/AcrR family transcriptional regulator [Actinomycetota bacterium]|nr:TetR/AcrR family transcriptional regulator [Actinomycetota bacterium]
MSDGDTGPVALSRGARTAARLRQSAREAFDELGWQATRVEDIVVRAGVSHGTFYTYYENKAAVLADLVRAAQADFVALASAPWKADDVRGALERIIGGFLDRYTEDRVVMRTWLQASREERSFADLYLESRALFVRRVADNVAAAVAVSGRQGGPPALTMASALVAMVEHFAYCWAVLGEEHERGDAVDALVLVWGSTLNELAGFEMV